MLLVLFVLAMLVSIFVVPLGLPGTFIMVAVAILANYVAAAGIGWAIGNLHLELSAEPTRLITADEPAVRQLLERLKVPYRQTTGIFRPGRFARGAQPSHELGPSHKH